MRAGWFRAAALGNLALVLAVGAHLLVPVLRFERDVPLARTHGWTVLSTLAREEVVVAYAPSYQLASQVAYYTGLPVDTAGPARFSQYDLWPEPALAPGQDALWVSEGREPPGELSARFASVEGPELLRGEYRGRVLHTFHVWRLRDARP
jgi:hypothetical protein